MLELDLRDPGNLKVAEHSFQVCMPNLPLLLNYVLAPVFYKS